MEKEKALKRISKSDLEINPYDFIICPNCGETEVGKYCPNCGQSNKDYNKPIKEIVGDLLDSINLDIRLLNTLLPFFFKPGFLSQEYFKGKRKRYVPPMRMYMFFSLIFFFLAQYASVKNINKQKDTTADSETGLPFFSINIDNPASDSTNYKGAFDKEGLRKEISNDSTASDVTKKAILGGLNIFENKESFITSFLKNLSYVLILLMPFFALILAMILWKSRLLYVKHLIFSINFHSFVFGLSSVVIILTMFLPEKISNYFLYVLWGIPIYLMVGVSRFYSRKLIGSFFKTIGALLIYSFVISIVLIIILFITAQKFA